MPRNLLLALVWLLPLAVLACRPAPSDKAKSEGKKPGYEAALPPSAASPETPEPATEKATSPDIEPPAETPPAPAAPEEKAAAETPPETKAAEERSSEAAEASTEEATAAKPATEKAAEETATPAPATEKAAEETAAAEPATEKAAEETAAAEPATEKAAEEQATAQPSTESAAEEKATAEAEPGEEAEATDSDEAAAADGGAEASMPDEKPDSEETAAAESGAGASMPDQGEEAEDEADTKALAAGVADGEVLGLPYALRELDNGLRAVAVKTDIPEVVSLQVVVRAGARDEAAGQSGYAHLFEDLMMTQGTAAYPPEAYDAVLKKAGAERNAYTSDDFTNYSVTFTKQDLDTILELEADRFQNLDFDEDAYREVASAVEGEYRESYAHPVRKAVEKLRNLAFTTHPYGHGVMGRLEDIEKLPEREDQARAFFDTFYRPNRAVVLLVGDVDPEAALARVEEHFSSWEAKDAERTVSAEPPPKGPKSEHVDWKSETQPWLFWAFRGPALDPSQPTLPALEALASVAFSETSPLHRRLVLEAQQVDDVIVWFPKRRDPSLLHIGMRLTDAAHAGAVRDAVHGALAELKARPLHPSRVERAKSRLRYEMTKALEDSKTTASALAKLIHFERTPETMDDLFETYAKLGPADLQSAAQTYFTDDRRFFVSVAPGAEISGFDANEGVEAAAASALFEGPAEVPDAPAASTATSTVPIRAKLMPSDGTPLVTLSYVFTTGAAYDPPGKKGLAALTAAMIADGGTRELSLAEIDAATYPMAADLEWQVDKEMTRLSATVHQDNLEAFYAFASAQLLDPGFRAEDLERNKEMIAHLIRTDLVANNDEELGKEALYRLIYGEAHPYSTYNLGIAAQVEKLTLDDVKRFYERHFRPRGLILGVAGGYPEDFPQKVMNDLGRLPQGSDAVLRLQPPVASEGRRALVLEKATPGVAVSAGAPIDVRRGDDDWIALWLARSWLGEHRSSNGELFREIREKRDLNFGDYAYIEYFPRAMFQFYPDANLGRRQQIFQMWLRPFRSNQEAHFGTRLAVQTLEELVEEGLTQAQLDATRSYLKKFVSLLMQTQARQLGYGVDAAFYGTPDFATYVRRGLDALTLDAVNAAIREHLDPSRLSFVFVTRDADNLVRRLTRDTPSQIESKPGLEEEDEAIAKKKLNMGSVTSKPADAMF